MILLALLAVALADLSVYFHNAQSSAPHGTVLSADSVGALVAHFVGSRHEASGRDLQVSLFVPSVTLSSRNSAVVVLGDFDSSEADQLLGEPALHIKPVASGTSWQPFAGPMANLAVSEIDREKYPVFFLQGKRSGPTQRELLAEIARVNSRVLVIGVPAGEQAPALDYSEVTLRPHFGTPAKPAKRSPGAAFSFSTKESCEEQTNGCSGHGSCVQSGDLYTCACKPTKDGGYTLHWEGSACEKRDVSWQFNLLAWTTLGIAILSAVGVKLLFSIGSEPLPGILSSQT